ncbi:alpha/beta hydrolase fold domain-containing protein [Mycobacterium paraintracellulare]|uniref:alpha/beta hydrolase fold domain-containing protein n=1 Tax=Mycobacterium paraintracellulare TaxID=1138383 RepID=UPI002351CBC3|nr:alpha/beta hydrolase fold domain-containing protein [Mycobacterium paraintracellulare]
MSTAANISAYSSDAARDPLASPLLAPDHRGLPPTLIQVAEHDPMRDDGTRYACALRAAGVPVRVSEYVGMPHGLMSFPRCAGPRHRRSPKSAPNNRRRWPASEMHRARSRFGNRTLLSGRRAA